MRSTRNADRNLWTAAATAAGSRQGEGMGRDRHRWQPVAPAPTGLVRPVPPDHEGIDGPTRGQAAGPGWRRTSRGLHVPAAVDGAVPEQRILEQSVRLPDGGAVTGWASLRLHGAGLVDGLDRDGTTPLPVPLALPPSSRLRPHPGAVIMRDRLESAEVRLVCGIPCTAPERGTFDAARIAPPLEESVVALDMACAGEVTSLDRMRTYVADRAGWKGVPRVRRALGLASEHSWSPNETRVRMIWCLSAGLPAPRVNRPLFDLTGRLLGYPDLLDLESGLVVEYDGADHRGATRHSRDVAREDVFRQHGLEVCHVTGPDLARPRSVTDRLLGARSRARWLAPADRTWTIEHPAGWDNGPSLEERLALRELRRESERGWTGGRHGTLDTPP